MSHFSISSIPWPLAGHPLMGQAPHGGAFLSWTPECLHCVSDTLGFITAKAGLFDKLNCARMLTNAYNV